MQKKEDQFLPIQFLDCIRHIIERLTYEGSYDYNREKATEYIYHQGEITREWANKKRLQHLSFFQNGEIDGRFRIDEDYHAAWAGNYAFLEEILAFADSIYEKYTVDAYLQKIKSEAKK